MARRERRPAAVKRPRAAAFTLIELLFVVAILGIFAALAAPHVGAVLSGGSLRTAARELAGAARYARTMALLAQTPVDLSVDFSQPGFSVSPADRSSASWFGISDLAAATNDVGYTDELLLTSARRQASLSSGFGLAVSRNDADSGAATNLLEKLAQDGEGSSGTPDATVSLADSIGAERKLSGVKVSFGGWRDVASTRGRRSRAESWSEGAEDGSVTVRFRANGTVRPHRWIVSDPDYEDEKLFIDVNAVGRAKISSPEDAR